MGQELLKELIDKGVVTLDDIKLYIEKHTNNIVTNENGIRWGSHDNNN